MRSKVAYSSLQSQCTFWSDEIKLLGSSIITHPSGIAAILTSVADGSLTATLFFLGPPILLWHCIVLAHVFSIVTVRINNVS